MNTESPTKLLTSPVFTEFELLRKPKKFLTILRFHYRVEELVTYLMEIEKERQEKK